MRYGWIRAVVLMSMAAPAVAQSAADRVALERIPAAFGAAWGNADGTALGALMVPEVDFVTVGATWLHGRRDFTLYHTRLLAKRFRGSTMVPLVTRAQFVKSDLAFARWS